MAQASERTASRLDWSGSNDIPISLKTTLRGAGDRGYREFRGSLEPRWARLWAQIALGYGLAAGVVVALALGAPSGLGGLLAALGGGCLIGYAIAYLNNFFHEAAHYNLAPGRRLNDALANLAMSWLFASSIQIYRRVHWQHHRALGTTMDSENSYFDPLRVRYLLEGLLGLKVLRTLRRYREIESPAADPSRPDSGDRRPWVAVALAVNAAIVVALALASAWAAAGAWVVGVLAFFPFFVSLRQVLEHRSENADPRVDYTRVDIGPTNRLFGDGPVASSLGSAGFNRHALHHWEPQVSCTRLRDLERFLTTTELEPYLAERRTTYARTFLRLLEP